MKVKKLCKQSHGKKRTRRKVLVQPSKATAASTRPSKAVQVTNRALDISVLGLDPAAEAKLKLAMGTTLGDLTNKTEEYIRDSVGTKVFNGLEAKLRTVYGLSFADGHTRSSR